MAEHGIDLVHGVDLPGHFGQRHPHLFGQRMLTLRLVGQELVQRRVKQANRDRAALHRLKDPLEILLLEGPLQAFLFLALIFLIN